MIKFHTVTFKEIGFVPLEYRSLNVQQIRVQIIQLACDFLMDGDYSEFNEPDALGDHNEIFINWRNGTVSVPVKQIYKPEYLQ